MPECTRIMHHTLYDNFSYIFQHDNPLFADVLEIALDVTDRTFQARGIKYECSVCLPPVNRTYPAGSVIINLRTAYQFPAFEKVSNFCTDIENSIKNSVEDLASHMPAEYEAGLARKAGSLILFNFAPRYIKPEGTPAE